MSNSNNSNSNKPFGWGVSSLTYQGETNSGDKFVVAAFTGGVLVAVIDALGHGNQAAVVAELAMRTLEQHAHENIATLIRRCHTVMCLTRGAAISLASFDWQQRNMTWLGIGNVSGVLVHTDSGINSRVTSLLVRSGVVGDRLPELQTIVVPYTVGTTLIMTTDGVNADYTEILPKLTMVEPQRLAQRILDDYARHDDDATVLVFRYNGDDV